MSEDTRNEDATDEPEGRGGGRGRLRGLLPDRDVARRRVRSVGGGSRVDGRRFIAVAVVATLLFAACIVRLGVVQLSDSGAAAYAVSMRTRTRADLSMRGMITDVNGRVLAQSVERYKITVDKVNAQLFRTVHCTGRNSSSCHSIDGQDVPGEGVEAVAALMATVLPLSASEIGGLISASASRSVTIMTDASPQEETRLGELNLNATRLVYTSEKTTVRQYPSDELLGSIIGGVNGENQGVAGVELMMNDALTGQDGKVSYQSASSSNAVIPGTQSVVTPKLDGGDVTLTVDSDVQWYTQQALIQGLSDTEADWGIAVVQEVGTGRIVAIADTQQVAAGSDEAKLASAFAVTQTFEPGSTGKVISLAAIIEEGLHQLSDPFTVPNNITVDGQTYKDAEAHETWHLTLAGVLQYSSNVGTIMAAQNLSLERRHHYLTAFGIGQSTGLGFPGESAGIYNPNYDSAHITNPLLGAWDGRTRNTILFGQGYSVTALQMTNAIATVAGGGMRVGQRLVEKATDMNGQDVTPTPNDSVRAISEETASQVMNAMESTAELYVKYAGVDGYRTAGKTGTSQIIKEDGTIDNVGDYIMTIPANDPKYVVGVFLYNPNEHGGYVAGPVTARIGQFLMHKYQVPKSPERTDAVPTKW